MSVSKLQLRPTISSNQKKGTCSVEENFQNEIVRPIVKLQNDLLLSYFEHFISIKKNNLNDLNQAQLKDILKKYFSRDSRLKADLKGLIIGLFTLEEFNVYLTMVSQINKRIYSIVEERITSSYLNS
tara:strand:+ start:306 stop:686 length:381 start_codon:yes stop_codon:yes gene_type:complete